MFMRGSVPVDQLLFDHEIERISRRLNNKTIRRQQLAKERRERERSSTSSPSTTTIHTPPMAEQEPPPPPPRVLCTKSPWRHAQISRNANNGRNSEMKTRILQLLYANPFIGLDHEDPYTHLTKSYEIAGSMWAPEADEEQLFKILFPHSLIGKAKEWYLDQTTQTMTEWNVLEEKILERFFPQNRFMEVKTSIAIFSQRADEALNKAWERFKSMLRKC